MIRDYDTSAGTFTMSGVEIIDINFATTGLTLDLEDVTGLTSLVVDSAVAVNTIANVEATMALTLANIAAGVTTINVDFEDGEFDGTTNTYSLTLNDVDDDLTLSLDTNGADVEAIETLTINTGSNDNGGAITFSDEGQDAATVTITGSADAELVGLLGTTISAAAATGDITLTGLGAADQTVTGGTGDDVFDFGTNLDSDDTVDGGAGSDTIVLSTTTGAILGTGTTANVANVSNVEILRLDTDLTGAITIDADRLTGLAIIDLDGAGGATETVTITDLLNASEVRVSAAQVAAVSIDLATNTAADTFTLTIDGAGITLGDVDTANAFINTFTIASDGTGANTITDASGITVNSIVVTGAQDLDMNANALAANVVSFNASAATGDVDVLMGDVASEVTGGSGDDDLAGGSAADIISGGAGADTIDGNGGNDTLTGGAGIDTFVIGEGTDTVTDFVVGAGNDLVNIDLSGVEALQGGNLNLVEVDLDGGDAAAADDAVGLLVAAALDLDTVTDGTNVLILDNVLADNTAVETALSIGGTYALTLGAILADDDGFLAFYSNGTDGFLVAVTNTSGADIADGDTLTVAELSVDTIATFSGITDGGAILDANLQTIVA